MVLIKSKPSKLKGAFMLTLKKYAILALVLTTAGAQGRQEKKKNSLRRNTTDLVRSTADNVQGAICATAQGADHLLYPALCFLVGKSAYNKGISAVLPNAPEKFQEIEKSIPGAHSARNGLTYLVIGGAVCVGLNYLSSITEVNAFLQKNMPHLSALLQHIKVDLSPEEVTRKK